MCQLLRAFTATRGNANRNSQHIYEIKMNTKVDEPYKWAANSVLGVSPPKHIQIEIFKLFAVIKKIEFIFIHGYSWIYMNEYMDIYTCG